MHCSAETLRSDITESDTKCNSTNSTVCGHDAGLIVTFDFGQSTVIVNFCSALQTQNLHENKTDFFLNKLLQHFVDY